MKRNKHVGETVLATNGQQMALIEYRNSLDVDVRFEDGTVREHVRYGNFRVGKISNPNVKKKNQIKEKKFDPLNNQHIGKEHVASNNQIMKIIAYRSFDDIDVMFEDGTIREHVRYGNFCKGTIANPNAPKEKVYKKTYSKKDYYDEYNNPHIGKEAIASNGQKMYIIAYRSASDIDVKFEDGTIREHVRYGNFDKGTIANPNVPKEKTYNKKRYIDELNNPHIGKTSMSSNGQMMTIIAYRGVTDIDVRFEDGSIREHVRYGNFSKGTIANPNQVIKSSFEFKYDVDGIKVSKGVKKIVDYLLINKREFQLEKKFEQCYYKGYLPFDLYVVDCGLIEFDGEQHFRHTSYFASEEEFLERTIRDQVKNTFCEMNNIPLLRIRYDQEDSIEELVEDFINNSNKYLKNHNKILSNEEYYSIRRTVDIK